VRCAVRMLALAWSESGWVLYYCLDKTNCAPATGIQPLTTGLGSSIAALLRIPDRIPPVLNVTRCGNITDSMLQQPRVLVVSTELESPSDPAAAVNTGLR
jgi:hypothetical protein